MTARSYKIIFTVFFWGAFFSLFSMSQELIWLCPSDPTNPDAKRRGPADYLNLFRPAFDLNWATTRPRVQVFKLYPGFIKRSTNEDLLNILAYLKSNHIALAIEWPVLTVEGTQGGGVEGFLVNGPQETSTTFYRLKNILHANVEYIAMDEPLFFGHYFNGDEHGAAIHWPINSIALNARSIVSIITSYYPQIKIGDIEAVDSFVDLQFKDDRILSNTQQWINAYQSATQRHLDFFHVDLQWKSRWKEDTRKIANLMNKNKIDFGVILNSNNISSDEAWMTSAKHNIQAIKNSNIPFNHFIFQDWTSCPQSTLPENNPSAYTALIDFFFAPEANIPPPITLERRKQKGRHVYGADPADIATLNSQGWEAEGSVGLIYPTIEEDPDLIPLYRIYSPTKLDYILTTDSNEIAQEQRNNQYEKEIFIGYVFPLSSPTETPLYKAYIPGYGHFYTSSLDEYSKLPSSQQKGICCYLPFPE
ncbi:MAG: hypothetical protein V4507_16850 [Verrucomicrobiota bacterium]